MWWGKGSISFKNKKRIIRREYRRGNERKKKQNKIKGE
jgi:hypothetical protein